jgi:lysozyme family protein
MANFDLAIPLILENEGGYQKNSNDNGNYNSNNELVGTNFGVSAKTFETWLGHPPTEAEVRGMQQSTAEAIYKRYFWDAYNIGLINDQYIASHIFDMYVNSSPKAAATIVQTAIKDVPPFTTVVDGVMGKNTRGTINQITANGKGADLNASLVNERKKYLASLNSQTFNAAWMNRADFWDNYTTPPVVVQASGYGFAFFILIGVYLMNKK